ncbi:DNA cytosine methyltransferase [Mycolicibacterium peregrinum]|uniref:DNA cytosine methyltransferase n=1 Tax=Mycolicibacterium peregrinum TaxID=43304 RepID=UPI000A473689|nr:DNA cytosine methyltransferase [Mycolicibacterium peregrinum]
MSVERASWQRISILKAATRCITDAEKDPTNALKSIRLALMNWGTAADCPLVASTMPASITAMPLREPGTEPRPKIIDLFAGPGGLDVGATWLGVPTTGIELDANACATRAKAGLTTVHADVRDYDPDDFPDATVLTGGPPCQTFTVAGKGSGRKALDEVIRRVTEMANHPHAHTHRDGFADDRTGLVLEPLRWALLAQNNERPFEAIVLEQVPAVLPVWRAFQDVLRDRGYGVAVDVLRSEEFGVPQTRRRAILIARLGDPDVKLPAATHRSFRKGESNQTAIGLRPWVSMGQALARGKAFTVVSNYGSGGDPKNRGERHSNEPSATVTGKIMRNRLRLSDGGWSRLTHQEAGKLQTFPPDFPWAGSDIGQQIGNAIPPRLAVHVLAEALKMRLDEDELDETVRASWFGGRPVPLGTQFESLDDRMATAAD